MRVRVRGRFAPALGHAGAAFVARGTRLPPNCVLLYNLPYELGQSCFGLVRMPATERGRLIKQRKIHRRGYIKSIDMLHAIVATTTDTTLTLRLPFSP